MGQRFGGQRAVVTGATSGIGRAIAHGLAAEGAHVHALGRSAAPGMTMTGGPFGGMTDSVTGGASGSLAGHPVDLGDDAAIARTVAEIGAALDGLDLLVLAAGVIVPGPVAGLPAADFDRQLRINLRAPFLLVQALLPLLRRRGGQVVFVNSSVWDRAGAGLAGYAASKYGLKALADVLRAETNPEGVRVLSVFPGRTASAMQEALHRRKDRPYRPGDLLQPRDVAEAVLAALAMPATAEVTEIHIRPARKTR